MLVNIKDLEYKKDTSELHNYVIKIQGRKLTLRSTNYSLDDKYNKMKEILLKARKK